MKISKKMAQVITAVTVYNDDYFTDFKTMTHKINHTNYPIINNKNECVNIIKQTFSKYNNTNE